MTDSEIVSSIANGHSTPASRWARFGPYYAMFPMEFACEVVAKNSKSGDLVLDPFAGRGSSVFSAAALRRRAYGIEINPVGWLYSNVKLNPCPYSVLIDKLDEILSFSKNYSDAAEKASEFFKVCFCQDVLCFLFAAKDLLNWHTNNTDATLMSFILLYLHGKRGYSLSNQMPMTKATSINYSLEWWKSKGLEQPPDVKIRDFFEKRFKWRYGKGATQYDNAHVLLGDSTELLSKHTEDGIVTKEVSLLFTSPPYFGVTNYFVDQWLRMWMLGGTDSPCTLIDEKYKKRFESKADYEHLLDTVFGHCSKIMSATSTVYVRTDVREFTLETTRKILKMHFRDYSYREEINSCKKLSQTELMNNSTIKPCEVDIILQRQ